MKEILEKIFSLESEQEYNEAFSLYKSLLISNSSSFEVWKYYFFFLWSMIEDVDGDFTIIKNENLNIELNKEFQFGIKHFENIAEFNFIVGYTISIFPYEFGDYDELEKIGHNLLHKATILDIQNPLYKMVFLGSMEYPTELQKLEYDNLKSEVRKLLLEQNFGKGLLNEYYRQVFRR